MKSTLDLQLLRAPRALAVISLVLALIGSAAQAQPALVGELVPANAGSAGNTIRFDYLGTGSDVIGGQADFNFSSPGDFVVTAISCSLPGCSVNAQNRRIVFLQLSEVADQTDAVVITFEVSADAAVGIYSLNIDQELYSSLLGQVSSDGSVNGSVDVSRVPVAHDDLFNADEDGGAISGNLRQDNGSGADEVGDPPFTYALVGTASRGILTLDNPQGDITYLPFANAHGTDLVGYTITDADNEVSDIGMITVMVNAAPDPRDDLLPLPESGSLTNVFVTQDNGSGSDDVGDGLGLVLVTSPPANAAQFELRNNGSFDYVPGPGFVIRDAFNYTITDADGDVGPEATVTILLDPVFADSFE